MPARDVHELEARIGYRFSDPGLLEMAVTHSSLANEQKGGAADSNERLEFLGDAVILLIVRRHLYNAYPDMPEGRMTALCRHVVEGGALAGYASEIELGSYLRLSRGEEKDGGREKPKLLEDAFEALLSALYLDSGSLDLVAAFLLPFVTSTFTRLLNEPAPLEDYKTLLQQYVQQTPGEELRYELVSESGPDNAKIFTVRVLINSNSFGVGVGSSKKKAEQEAARVALQSYLPAE